MPRCTKCEKELVIAEKPKKNHCEVLAGIHVVLFDCVNELRCPDHPEEAFTEIPDLLGLTAAVALVRIRMPRKLSGIEIRFLRKAAKWKAKDLAKKLQVSEEVVSRWENGKLAIGPSTEKLLRLTIGYNLYKQAPGVEFEPVKITSLELRPVDEAGKPLHVYLDRRPISRMTDHERTTATGWLPNHDEQRQIRSCSDEQASSLC